MVGSRLKRLWARKKRDLSDYGAELRADLDARRPLWQALAGAVAALLLLSAGLGWHWSREPALFSVPALAQAEARRLQQPVVVGSASSATLIALAETLLDKRGGYLSNDLLPPGAWQDNIPSWEFGVLVQVRDMSKALREAFSRSQSQSREDKDLALAEPRFNFDHRSWLLPSSEAEYRQGIKLLRNYQRRLADADERDGQFYARADNLNYWLRTVESRLGSLSQRLTASVAERRVNTDLAGDTAARQSTVTPGEVLVQTSWWEIDNVFYEARGTAWALLHLLRAVEVDFADVLAKKNAQVSLRQIIRELEATQAPLHSPMVLNGGGFGVLANHSLVMASYISRANAAIIDLRGLLSEG